MNRADKIFIVCVVLLSCFLYVPLLWTTFQNKDKQKEVVVQHKNDEVLRVDIKENASYVIAGTLGEVLVEIQDEAVRVEKENSPYHLCSIQGWVEDTGRPIICLPNEIVVKIETDEEQQNSVDTVIQ